MFLIFSAHLQRKELKLIVPIRMSGENMFSSQRDLKPDWAVCKTDLFCTMKLFMYDGKGWGEGGGGTFFHLIHQPIIFLAFFSAVTILNMVV